MATEELVGRVRAALAGLPRVEEKRSPGGTAFMVNGRVCLSAGRGRLTCRIDPDLHQHLVWRPGTRALRKGLVSVDQRRLRSARELRYWIGVCLDYNWKGSFS